MNIAKIRMITIVLAASLAFGGSGFVRAAQTQSIVQSSDDVRFFNPLTWFVSFLYELFYGSSVDNSGPLISVRLSNALCAGEQASLAKRSMHAQVALQNFLGNNFAFEATPQLAVCTSGGGYRAMISAAGFYDGLEQIGLLDALSYAAASSGSSWFLIPWLMRKTTARAYAAILKSFVQEDFFVQSTPVSDIFAMLNEKYVAGKHVSMVDVCAGLLADRLMADLGDGGQNLRLSDSRSAIENGTYPYPLIAVLLANANPYEMLEISPHEMYSPCAQSALALEGLGSLFEKGVSASDVVEECAAYIMAVSGAAYSLSIDDILHILRNYIDSAWIQSILDDIISDDTITDVRTLPIKVPNPWLGLSQDSLGAKKYELGDAGLLCNIPIQFFLRPERNVHTIIVCDTSTDLVNYAELKTAAEYALRYGYPFPSLDVPVYKDDVLTIFEDQKQPEAPIVFYFAIDADDYSILQFQYSNAEYDDVFGRAQRAVIDRADILRTYLTQSYAPNLDVTPLVAN